MKRTLFFLSIFLTLMLLCVPASAYELCEVHGFDYHSFDGELIDYVGNDDIPEELTDFDNLGDTVMPTSCVLYLTAYKSIKNNDPDCASAMLRTGLLSSFHSLHIRGAVLMVSGDFDGATRLFDLALSSDDGGFFSRYKLLCDLEFCRKSAGDFEAAYSLSTSRMEMLGMFSK